MKLKGIFRDRRGFMAIVALGIFGVLTVFGLMLQRTVMQTYDSVRGSTDHLSARLISDSVMDHLEFLLRDADVGFNVGGTDETKVTCEFGVEERDDGQTRPPTTTDPGICSELSWIADAYEGKRVEVVLETRAHALVNESLKTNVFDWSNGTYTVPFPGTGDAGARCGMYNPVFGTDVNDANIPQHLLPKNFGQTGGPTHGGSTLDQLDYSCNWNKLAFGSAITDRVALPLYYAKLGDNNTLNFVNPFKEETARNFALRLRTPCKPCFYGDGDDDDEMPDGYRPCTRGDDPTVCAPGERYTLASGAENIIVQWQLSGRCEIDDREQDCTMIASVGDPDSEISESKINFGKMFGATYLIMENNTPGSNISVSPAGPAAFLDPEPLALLPKLQKPVLTLFLSSALISEGGNVPYLEYQLVTDSPVSNNTTVMKVEVTVDGNSYQRVIEKPVRMPLIDFALQN